jgi:hypothetical protein
MRSSSCCRLSLALALLLVGLAPQVLARGGGGRRGEYERLVPGSCGYVTWIHFQKVAAQAAQEKLPVLVYVYEAEKNRDNAQEMIAAQMRLFPDDEIRARLQSFICTRIDHTHPEEALREAPDLQGRGLLEVDEDDKEGEGADEGEGEEEVDAPGEEPEPAAEPEPEFFPQKLWPHEISFVLLDYRGRVLKRVPRITSSTRNFLQVLEGVVVANAKIVRADEKEAERAARKAERERAREERRQAEEPEQDPPPE